jgi:predicted transcriptional regulator of viral defense system
MMDTQADPRARLYDVAEQQSGYFTASQALEAGYSRASQHYHQKVGNWRREGHGIYRLDRFPHMPDEHYVRLMLWSRDRAGNIQAVVSHETALQAYELSDVMPAKIHLTVPKGFRKQPPPGVKLYRQDLPASDVTERDGYRITTPLRTLLDTAASALSAEHLASAVQDALEQGLVRRKVLTQAVSESSESVKARFAGIGLS